MQTDDPLEILADVEALRSRTSTALNADGWQWMTVWSLVAFGAGLTALVDALEGIALCPEAAACVDVLAGLVRDGRVEPDERVVIFNTGAAQKYVEAIAADLDLVRHDPLLLGSDHLGFLEAGIPALFLFTGGYPEMNSPADSLGAIDLAGLERVLTATGELVTRLAVSEGSFDFVGTSLVPQLLLHFGFRPPIQGFPDLLQLLGHHLGVAYDASMIGVFDSGVGGMSVVQSIRRLMPTTDVLYFADSGRAPYGRRPLDEVREFAEQITDHLLAAGADLIVVGVHERNWLGRLLGSTPQSLLKHEVCDVLAVRLEDAGAEIIPAVRGFLNQD